MDKSRGRRLWSQFWRITVGILLIIAGLVMCITPGPGIVTIVAGLAVMAPEVPVADRMLQWMKRRYRSALEKVREARK